MSDACRPPGFTLSYEEFMFPPDVSPYDFVILYAWVGGSRKERE